MDTFPLPQDSSEAMTFEQYKNQQAPIQINLSDTVANPFKEAADGTAVNLLARTAAIGGSAVKEVVNSISDHIPLLPKSWVTPDIADLSGSGAKDLTPEQANARYPEMATKWNKPVNPYVAQMLSDREEEAKKRQLAIEMGPQDAFSKTIQFGAGLLAHAMDPLETGAGMLTGWGVGAVVAKSVWGSAAAAAVKAGSANLATRAAFHGIEAVGGNLIQNTALEAGTQGVMHQENVGLVDKSTGKPIEFSPEEAMQNVAINTFFGSLFHMGVKEFSFQASNKFQRFLKNTNPSHDVTLARTTVGNLTEGVNPAPEKIMQAIVGETDVKGEYQYQPLENSQGKKFYIAADPSGQPLPLGDDIGEGTRMTDNPHKAAAAGDVMHEVEASKLNSINTNGPIPENARAAFETAIQGVETDKKFLDGSARDVLLSIKDAIDQGAIPEDRIVKLQEDLKGLGYNAFHSDGTDVFGFEHSPHNDLTVFDDSVIEHKNTLDTSNAPKNDPSPEAIQEAINHSKDPRNSLEVDAHQLDQSIARMQENDSLGLGKDGDFKYLDDQIQVQKDHLESLNQQGILDAQGAAELADIQKYEKLEQVGRTLLKAAADCVTKYG